MGPISKKRQEKPVSHISAPCQILSKRPRRAVPPQKSRALHIWSLLERDIHCALKGLRDPSLAAITSAICEVPPSGQVPAVCFTMGAAAAAGDRSHAFDAVATRLTSTTRVIRFHSAHHATLSSVMAQVQDIGDERAIVAVEDTELFPEHVLRDLVYWCGKRSTSMAGKRMAVSGVPIIAMLFGLGISPSPVHAALGIQEAGMISPIVINSPPAAACLLVVVRDVLSKQRGIMISRDVFELIEDEFFMRETTVAMVIRALRQIFTLHLLDQPLGEVFCNVDLESKDEENGIRQVVGPGVISRLRSELDDSVVSMIKTSLCTDDDWDISPEECKKWSLEDTRNQCISWYETLCQWRARKRLMEEMVYDLLITCEVPESEWKQCGNGKHSELRLLVFKAFLVKSGEDLSISSGPLMKLLLSKMKNGGRPFMLKVIETMKRAITRSRLESNGDIAEAVKELESVENGIKHDEQGETDTAVQKNEESTKTLPTRRAQGSAAARRRRMELLSNGVKEKKPSVLKAYREKLCSTFKQICDLIIPLYEVPMHKVMLFTNKKTLQKYSGGMGRFAEPRNALFTAMRQANKILGHGAKVADTGVAYQILAEGGRLVSLYDWYNSFAAATTAASMRKDGSGNVEMKTICNAELQARFARACSELELFGVLKYTNRKTDHVQRLVFE